jgi:hypothetical protein
MFIALVVKEPFEVGLGEDFVLKFVDTEGAVTDTASC